MKARIKSAKLMRVNQIWKKHKPQGLGFSDTDVIIVKLDTGNESFTQDFYCRLKGDGTIGRSITGASKRRQGELRNFIRKYISQKENYNVRKDVGTWKGKEVEVEKINGGFVIKI